MSSTLLEVTRAGHEYVERLERLIVKDLLNDPPTPKDRLYQTRRARNNIDVIIATTEKLIEIYEDKDNARKDEVAALGGQTASGINVFSSFYDRLKEIREYYRKNPAAQVVDSNEEDEALLKEEPIIEFSGEEALGRYLDLHELFNQYINSKFGAKIEYSAYLDVFSHPHTIPLKLKLTRQYRDYMENLLEYLIYFFHRTEPLQDLGRIFSKVEAEFEELWANGLVQGWQKQGRENEEDPSQHTVIDLNYYSTVEQLMEVDPEKLKEALAALGLKSGGTVQQRAERLFLTKHIPLEHLCKKYYAKGSHGPRPNRSAVVSQDMNNSKHVALTEAKMKKLCDLLSKTIEQTKENVVKKQALTYEEMEQERDEEETQVDSESDADDQQIHNPLKLPFGWDGKPIPYWLYKLHGLDQVYECEICGNCSYRGRRAFERHFKDWQHQHGMRCLGIPNTKNFNEITKIEDARGLWAKIQERQGVNKWCSDLGEEFEDREGNIYNKKTYTDLQRQGLI